ncbi:hypothetical protein INR49_023789, partial [Caranx melampygus]
MTATVCFFLTFCYISLPGALTCFSPFLLHSSGLCCSSLEEPKALMKMGLSMILIGHVNFLLGALVHGVVLRHINLHKQARAMEYAISNVVALTSGLVTWSLFSVSLAASIMAAASAIGLLVSVVMAIIHGGRSLLTHCRFPNAIGYSSITNECPFDPTRIYSSWWLALNPLLHLSPEYHSDSLGASDRDLCHPDGLLCPMLWGLRFIPRPALLPKQEDTQRLWQSVNHRELTVNPHLAVVNHRELTVNPHLAILNLHEPPVNLHLAVLNLPEAITNLQDRTLHLQDGSTKLHSILPASTGVFLPLKGSPFASRPEKGQAERGRRRGL